MPHEDRRIYFDYEETYKALYSFCIQKGMPKPPPGRIVSVESNMEHPLEVDVVLKASEEGPSESRRYSKDFVVAALMIMCGGIGIPLPKSANKKLELSQDKVILRVQRMR